MPSSNRFDTHEVLNQSPPYDDVDLFLSDRPLQDAVRANGAGSDAKALSAFGRRWGAAEMFELARQANANPPRLHAFDAHGFRRDFVEYHPAYHLFMTESFAARHAGFDLARRCASGSGAGAGRPRGPFLHGGAGRDRASVPHHHDAGRGCGARGRARLAASLMGRIAAREYDPVSGPGRTRRASRSAWA